MDYIKSWGLSILTALGFVQPEVQPPASLPVSNMKFEQKGVAYNFTFVQGDITQQRVDVIVNAANEDLSHGGGVALAIRKAAGWDLQEYCDDMPRIDKYSRCPMG